MRHVYGDDVNPSTATNPGGLPITANGNYYLGRINKKRDNGYWLGTLFVQGTFGSGTVTFGVSLDRGTTIIPINDLTQNVVSFTGNGLFNLEFGNSSRGFGDAPMLYAIVSGATSPNLIAGFYDND